VSLASLTKLESKKWGRKESQAKQTRATRNIKNPLTSPNALELNLGERIDHLNCVFGVKCIALVLNALLLMLGWLEWRWLGVFIALNHQFNC
jgi:hypothetical protein